MNAFAVPEVTLLNLPNTIVPALIASVVIAGVPTVVRLASARHCTATKFPAVAPVVVSTSPPHLPMPSSAAFAVLRVTFSIVVLIISLVVYR